MAKIKYLDKSFTKVIIKLIDSNNLNFLIGSGFSANVLKTLGNIEKVMTIIMKEPENNKYKLLEALLYWHFFELSIYPMVSKINFDNLIGHIEFVSIWKQIITKRENPILQKQLNIFTTNYDVVLEYSMENSFADYNDGFSGRINPYFTTANYNKIYYKQALFSNRRSELPIFNLLKLHGSITWKNTDQYDDKFIYGDYIEELQIFYDANRELVYNPDTENGAMFNSIFEGIDNQNPDEITKEFIDGLIEHIVTTPEKLTDDWIPFIENYKTTFKIVNPTKEKFSDTLANKNYYELLRIYCNELERENTLLFVYGFSFNDEHIEDITKRVLNNPALIMIIFAYSKRDMLKFAEKFAGNSNVWIIGLEIWYIDTGNEEAVEEYYEEYADFFGEVANAVELEARVQAIEESRLNLRILNNFFKNLI